MRCPACKTTLTRVIRTEPSDAGTRRRRRCLDPACGHRWTTFETNEDLIRQQMEEGAQDQLSQVRRPGIALRADREASSAAAAVDRRREAARRAGLELAQKAEAAAETFWDRAPARLDRESFARETGRELPED